MKTKNVITAIALTVCAGFAAPAFAGSANAANSVEADISGLDLSTPEGRAKAESRIERAAEHACLARSGPQPLSYQRATAICVDAAIKDAMGRVFPKAERVAEAKTTSIG
ncbi:UrcA family protein [Henriciella barbarensis]|uniref:UrcA family protein n=1 Tax=Henriciella barbarensis TaxID=86342 RepID=A0A399QXN5_9PROT|nr:UrcA family protein [Henriciella barbarensis]RIJ22267.1 UrcA family protein [Henriciella barbarensis]